MDLLLDYLSAFILPETATIDTESDQKSASAPAAPSKPSRLRGQARLQPYLLVDIVK